jgi:hypothetical protein
LRAGAYGPSPPKKRARVSQGKGQGIECHFTN